MKHPYFSFALSLLLSLRISSSLRHTYTHQLKLKRLKLVNIYNVMGGCMAHFSCHMQAWATINPHLGWGGELQHSVAFRFRSSEFVTDTGLKVPCRVRGMDTVCSVMMLNTALLVPHTPQPFNISLVDYRLTL